MTGKQLAASKPTQFKPNQVSNPKGRPKAVARYQIAEALSVDEASLKSLSKTDYDDVDRLLPSMSTEQLKSIANNNDINIYVRNQAYAILVDLQDGKTATVDKMRDRVIALEESSRVASTSELRKVTGKFKGGNFEKALKVACKEIKQVLVDNNTYAKGLDFQVEVTARYRVQMMIIDQERASDTYSQWHVEISREGNTRITTNPLEALALRVGKAYQDSLRSLGLNYDSKGAKIEQDHMNEWLKSLNDE